MAQNVNFTLHGLKELNEALKTLPEIIGRQVAINVLTEVSEPMLAEARSTAAFVDRSGKLRKSIKAQFRNADRLKATFAIIVGEEELKTQTVKLKNLLNGTEETIQRNEIVSYLKTFFAKKD